MKYTLRSYEDGDAEAISRLTIDAIRTIGAQAYSPEQVRVWSSGHLSADRFVARAHSGHYIYVMIAETGETKPAPIAAYALLEPDGHLDMLYCAPAHAGRGLAGRLLAHAEVQARAFGITNLYTEASELARPAFLRAGYMVIKRRDFEVEGVAIHNYAMEKVLEKST